MLDAAPRVVVLGPAEDAPDDDRVAVRLHPVGTKARGWGWESDTREAIEWLVERVKPGMTVADIGTGTGILAIVAAKLGGIVVAYEENEAVRPIAIANFTLNNVDVDLWPEYDDRQGFDLVVANLGDVQYALMLTAGVEVWTSGEAS